MNLRNADSPNLTRVFIAIDFPGEIIREVARVQEALGKWNFVGKFTELENLHLTLKFLGEINSETMEKVKIRLGKIKFTEIFPFYKETPIHPISHQEEIGHRTTDLKLGNLGLFNHMGRTRIAWIKVEGVGIWELQKRIDEALEDLFKKEERFMSHLTIARIKYVRDSQGFKNLST